MVQAYTDRMRAILPVDCQISLSRRGLESPMVRVTRFSGWEADVNPWKQPERLPVLYDGLFAQLIYANEPRIVRRVDLADGDPARKYLEGMQSLLALPLFDGGESINMVLLGRKVADGFDNENLPEWVWMSNLFGRATQTLVLKSQLEEAYDKLDQEMKNVGRIQRALLPATLPEICTMQLAAYYQTSTRAGGDYYDFFELPDDRWGILVADVSGHGTPAAVIMAITHGLAHSYAGAPTNAADLLTYLNGHLFARYTGHVGGFVTAFYGVYDARTRTFDYSSAGHNPPRLKRCTDGSISSLDAAQSLPLGITADAVFEQTRIQFEPGDQMILYTDGITEAMDPAGQQFGVERLDKALENCMLTADGLLQTVVQGVEDFAAGHAPDDDRTMLVAKIR
jgi:sigma-B regulation protein RsbU (phosphoserine phosphatase)